MVAPPRRRTSHHSRAATLRVHSVLPPTRLMSTVLPIQQFSTTTARPSHPTPRIDFSEQLAFEARLAFARNIARGEAGVNLAEAALQVAAEDDAIGEWYKLLQTERYIIFYYRSSLPSERFLNTTFPLKSTVHLFLSTVSSTASGIARGEAGQNLSRPACNCRGCCSMLAVQPLLHGAVHFLLSSASS